MSGHGEPNDPTTPVNGRSQFCHSFVNFLFVNWSDGSFSFVHIST